MRKIIFLLHTGYCGMDAWENDTVPDDMTDDELDQEAWNRAVQHAESYSLYPDYDKEYYSEEELESMGEESFSSGIEGSWYDYDPELHDGHSTSGKWHWSE